MAKNANINIRIEPEIKSAAENLFSSFGITISDAVNIFIRKSLMEGGIPFPSDSPGSMPKQKPPCRKPEILLLAKFLPKNIIVPMK